jgi:hypothetical protein
MYRPSDRLSGIWIGFLLRKVELSVAPFARTHPPPILTPDQVTILIDAESARWTVANKPDHVTVHRE